MRTSGLIFLLVLSLFTQGMICQTADGASERGAKSMFYDPYAGGKAISGDSEKAASDSVKPDSDYNDRLKPGIRYWIELIRPGNKPKRVSNDRVFRSGDKIRLHITPNADGYLYVLHTGSTGAKKLVPIEKVENGTVRMGLDYVVPSAGGWLRFDENPGKEKLNLLFVSVKSSDELLGVMKHIPGQPVSEAANQLSSIYNKYGGSSHYAAQVESGSKDLIVETGRTDSVSHTSSTVFNTGGASNFKVAEDTYDAPANYVVNTAGKKAGEPVVIEIVLEHRSKAL